MDLDDLTSCHHRVSFFILAADDVDASPDEVYQTIDEARDLIGRRPVLVDVTQVDDHRWRADLLCSSAADAMLIKLRFG